MHGARVLVSDPVEALARSHLFHDLPRQTLAQLAAVTRQRTFRRGEVLVRQGDPGDALYVIMAGEVKVLIEAPTGVHATLAILGPGNCVGEFSLIDGEPRSATVEAIDRVDVLVLLRRDFLDVIRANSQAMERLLVTLVGRLRRTDELAADLALLDIKGRLAKTLLDLAREHGRRVGAATEIELQVTQTDLASMVGGTRERVNKVLSWLEQDGAIERHGRHIVVLDFDLLRQAIS